MELKLCARDVCAHLQKSTAAHNLNKKESLASSKERSAVRPFECGSIEREWEGSGHIFGGSFASRSHRNEEPVNKWESRVRARAGTPTSDQNDFALVIRPPETSKPNVFFFFLYFQFYFYFYRVFVGSFQSASKFNYVLTSIGFQSMATSPVTTNSHNSVER